MHNSLLPNHLQAHFRSIEQSQFDLIEASLRENFFTRNAPRYLSTEAGKNDLDDHLRNRLNGNRQTIIPWLDSLRPLNNSHILEIGCGTGSSTVALAEQGATVVGVDVDKDALEVNRERCRVYGLEVSLVQANATQVDELFAGHNFDYIIFYA